LKEEILKYDGLLFDCVVERYFVVDERAVARSKAARLDIAGLALVG